MSDLRAGSTHSPQMQVLPATGSSAPPSHGAGFSVFKGLAPSGSFPLPGPRLFRYWPAAVREFRGPGTIPGVLALAYGLLVRFHPKRNAEVGPARSIPRERHLGECAPHPGPDPLNTWELSARVRERLPLLPDTDPGKCPEINPEPARAVRTAREHRVNTARSQAGRGP
jgi:hypothetical protein